jgi:voltage-gated potassium channel
MARERDTNSNSNSNSDSNAPSAPARSARETVRFYLLDHATWLGKAIDVALLGLNLVFIAVFVAETYPATAAFEDSLWRVELTVAGVFVVEYVLRLYGAKDRLDEATNPYTVVDLVAVVPTLAVAVAPDATVAADIAFLRALRVVRVLRFYRFTRDEEFFFGTVTVGTLRAVKLLLTVLTVLFVGAGLFYSVEHAANPNVDAFGDAFYYIVVTLTTVGFGDITPTTVAGRWVTVSAILGGVILIPWQASKIVKAWTSDDRVEVTCPECGLTRHDADASHCKSCGHVIYQEFDGEE